MKGKIFLVLTLSILTSTISFSMEDSLAADCRTSFITGRLWKGQPIKRDEIDKLLKDIGPLNNTYLKFLDEAFGEGDVEDLIKDFQSYMEEVSVTRGDPDNIRDNIKDFSSTIKEISKNSDQNALKQMISMIMLKY